MAAAPPPVSANSAPEAPVCQRLEGRLESRRREYLNYGTIAFPGNFRSHKNSPISDIFLCNESLLEVVRNKGVTKIWW